MHKIARLCKSSHAPKSQFYEKVSHQQFPCTSVSLNIRLLSPVQRRRSAMNHAFIRIKYNFVGLLKPPKFCETHNTRKIKKEQQYKKKEDFREMLMLSVYHYVFGMLEKAYINIHTYAFSSHLQLDKTQVSIYFKMHVLCFQCTYIAIEVLLVHRIKSQKSVAI